MIWYSSSLMVLLHMMHFLGRSHDLSFCSHLQCLPKGLSNPMASSSISTRPSPSDFVCPSCWDMSTTKSWEQHNRGCWTLRQSHMQTQDFARISLNSQWSHMKLKSLKKWNCQPQKRWPLSVWLREIYRTAISYSSCELHMSHDQTGLDHVPLPTKTLRGHELCL